jgi:hypothetical protein
MLRGSILVQSDLTEPSNVEANGIGNANLSRVGRLDRGLRYDEEEKDWNW